MKHTDTTSQAAETSDSAASSSSPASLPSNLEKQMQNNMQDLPSYGPNANQTAGLSTAVQKHIGNLLKVSYQDLLTEPVPDRFANLLEQLEQAEKKVK